MVNAPAAKPANINMPAKAGDVSTVPPVDAANVTVNGAVAVQERSPVKIAV